MSENEKVNESLLTYAQVGKVLGVTPRSVWTLVKNGELPAIRFGGSVRFDPADLRAFVKRSKNHLTTVTTGD